MEALKLILEWVGQHYILAPILLLFSAPWSRLLHFVVIQHETKVARRNNYNGPQSRPH
jgi:hypothetical protein